jgi:hypothetical protein
LDSINALDLIGGKAKPEEIFKSEELLKMNYGVEYPQEKFTMLWDMIREEGWTNERLKQTVKYFLKNKKFATWTIADWFDYGVKLYSYSKYLEELMQKGASFNNEIEWFKIDGVPFWKYKDGIELPESLRNFNPPPEQKADTSQVDTSEFNGYAYIGEMNKIIYNDSLTEKQKDELLKKLDLKYNINIKGE